MRREVGSLVREARNAGRSVMFSSHVLSEVEENCDRVAVLKRGRVAGNLVLAEIRKQHRIEGRVSGALPPLDPALSQAVVIQSAEDGHLIVDVKDSLSRALGWLGQLSWKELRIEPVGLRSIYDTLQGPEADESTSTSEAAA
jgi:ABC-2 type transport system ATP-binding protein